QDVATVGYYGELQIVRVVDGVASALPPVELNVFQPYSLAAADFNGDQKLDVAILSYFGVTIVLGNGDGTFQDPVTIQIIQNQRQMVAGDVNGDGAADLVLFAYDPSNQPEILTLINDGTSNFLPGPATPLTHSVNTLIAGRFDPGPTLDLVATNGDCCG